jgi:hypothetical protein
MEQKYIYQHTNNFCLYCGKLGHVVCECLKKHGSHAAHATFVTNSQPKELENDHVQF